MPSCSSCFVSLGSGASKFSPSRPFPVPGSRRLGIGGGTGYDVVLSRHGFYPLRLRLDFITLFYIFDAAPELLWSIWLFVCRSVSGGKGFSTSLAYSIYWPIPVSQLIFPRSCECDGALSLCLHAVYPPPLYGQQLYRRVLRVHITEVEIPSVSQDASRHDVYMYVPTLLVHRGTTP
ncbi:hypothetical protein DFP73DRAFT_163304 [Morchella snyderi]|nr:hypothetical protein DFP73DRAFT_163304 [Morchella snyderi]